MYGKAGPGQLSPNLIRRRRLMASETLAVELWRNRQPRRKVHVRSVCFCVGRHGIHSCFAIVFCFFVNNRKDVRPTTNVNGVQLWSVF